jgi:hypothetical protein
MQAIRQFLIPDGTPSSEATALVAINAAISSLAKRRRPIIERSGHLARSKIGWKLETFVEALLYCLVALAEGAALAWNGDIPLASFLCTRAIVETCALLFDFEQQLQTLFGKEDLGAIDALAMNRTFSSRDSEWLQESPEHQAVNVLTLIDRMDERLLPGARDHYDRLSERCHPNSFGHHLMFSQTNYDTGDVSFDSLKSKREIATIIAGLGLIPIAELTFVKLTKLIEHISDLHHRVRPSPLT